MTTKQQLINFWRTMNVEERLLNAFEEVPRERFIVPSLRKHAYDDQPLPTIRKQSISQPSTIVIMLGALNVQPGEKVFEVGAGVGYQAAIISRLLGSQGKLITTEVIPELVYVARKNLGGLGLNNAMVLETDGGEGYPSEAPYDKIIITTACPTIPQPLIDQLKEGGIIVAPVGDLQSQTMVKCIKTQGHLEMDFLGDFVFVPMRGKWGFKEIEMYYDE